MLFLFFFFFNMYFFLNTVIKPSASGVQIISPNLHHSCISVEKQSLTRAADTLGGHQGKHVVLASDNTGESAYIPQLLWDRERGIWCGRSGNRGFKHFCLVRQKEERDEPVTGKGQTHQHHEGTRGVCRPKVHVIYTTCHMFRRSWPHLGP